MRILLCLLCILSSCTMVSRVVCKDTSKPQLSLPAPQPLRMDPVKFKVVHKDNAGAVFSDLEKKKEEPVLFGLTGVDYKNLATNIEQLKAYILTQKKIIELQRKYYEGK